MKTKWDYEAEIVRFLSHNEVFLNIDLGFHEWRFIRVVLKNPSVLRKRDRVFGTRLLVEIIRTAARKRSEDTYQARIIEINGKTTKKSTKETQRASS